MIDAHAHLTDARFADDLADVLERAAAAGVLRVLTCGEDLASSERAADLAASSSLVRAAVGVHPHRAQGFDDRTVARLRELLRRRGVVGVGEIGMDLSGRSAPREAQERAFREQLRLAADAGVPVTVHVRDAGAVAREIIDLGPPVRGHVHCYSEGPMEVDAWVSRGFHVSFSGTVTFPRSDALRAAARRVPLDRLLVETDAPYLAPQPMRGRRNEPAFIAATYAVLARERGLEPAALAAQVERNARELFGSRW